MPPLRPRNSRIAGTSVAALRLGTTLFGWLLLAGACSSPHLPAPAPVRQLDVYTTQYVTLAGSDTVSVEMVTTCLRRIIGDVSSRKPMAFVHYEIEFGANKFPRELVFAFWAAPDSAAAKPHQIARTTTRGDSVWTEVWRGTDHQLQSAQAPVGSFVWTTGYVGLLAQLLAALHEDANSRSIPLFFIATSGHTSIASIMRVTGDSILIGIDSARVAARWSPTSGLGGATYLGSGFRIDRVPVRAQALPNDRCGQPPFLRDTTTVRLSLL